MFNMNENDENTNQYAIVNTYTDKEKKDLDVENKQGEEENENVNLDWIWELTRPERSYVVAGFIGAALVGAAFPFLGFFLSKMISVFFHTSANKMRADALKWAYVFIGNLIVMVIL